MWISQFIKVELGSKAGALKQMLLEVLDDPHEIRRICIMGRHCTLYRGSKEINCDVTIEKHIAEGKSHSHLYKQIYIWKDKNPE